MRIRRGLTLVELTIIVIIVGVAAALAVPSYLAAAERSRAALAFAYLAAVQAAQERHLANEGAYAADRNLLDVTMPAPKYFIVGVVCAGATGEVETSWRLTLTRAEESTHYGPYTVTFCETGFDPANSTVDELASIHPLRP
jgi:Tfp pilus assembly protein PilE